MHKRFLGLIFLVVFGIAADSSGWQLVDIQFVNDVLGQEGRPPFEAVLSPDGSMLAWGARRDGLCVFVFAESATSCTLWPEDYDRSGTDLVWSADSQFLAFTESFFLNFREPDLWTFEVATGAFVNRTQDNEIRTPIEDGFNGLLDYLPTWSPADNTLYFFRSEKRSEGRYSLTLMRMNGEAAELVRDLTSDLPRLSVFRQAVIDSSGQYMAIPVAAQDRDDPANGLWLLNLQSGDFNQLAGYPDFYAAVPEWIDKTIRVNVEDVQWAGSQGLVVLLYSGDFSATYGLVNYYYIDLATGVITPLFDFSGLSNPADIFRPDSEGRTPFSRFPRVGVAAPDGSAFFYVHFEEPGSNVRISALPLPPGTGEPQQLGFLETSKGALDLHPTIAENGKAYMFAYVMQFERQ